MQASFLGVPSANDKLQIRRWFDLLTTRGYRLKYKKMRRRYREAMAAIEAERSKSKRLVGKNKCLRDRTRTLQREKQLLVKSLSQMKDPISPIELIQTLVSSGALTPPDLHIYLKDILHYRRIELLRSLLSSRLIGDEALHLYHSVRLAQDRGQIGVSARELCRTYQGISNDSFLRSPFFNLLVEQAVRQVDVTLLADLLSEQPDGLVRKIPLGCSMGVCRVLIHHHRHDECRGFLRCYLAGVPRHQRICFLEPARLLFDPQQEEFRDLTTRLEWRSLLDEVDRSYEVIDRDNYHTFRRIVTQQLHRIPESAQDCMNIRFDAGAKARLLSHIAEAIEGKRPLSFIRVGDGEGYAYDSPRIQGVRPEEFTTDKLTYEQQWWGMTLDPVCRAKIGDQVRAAIAGATVLGIPSVYRIVRDFGRPKQRFGSTRSQRGLLIVLNALGDSIPIGSQIFTEERANHILFDRDSLINLARGASRLVIVACWSPDKLALPTTVETEYVPVPPNMRVPDEVRGEEANIPLHTSYPEIIRRVEELCAPGVLVLVAAGIIGKIFVEHACRSGAVAIDLGSVADYLAGYKTRAADVI